MDVEFVDYEQAFNTFSHYAVFNALQTQGVSELYMGLLSAIYRNVTVSVNLLLDI